MARRYLCGTPPADCSGAKTFVNFGLTGHKGGMVKAHIESRDAFNCYRRWLLAQGYEEVGPRDFRSPQGGPILTLEKSSRFGGKLRHGKGLQGSPDTKRFEPFSGGGIVF